MTRHAGDEPRYLSCVDLELERVPGCSHSDGRRQPRKKTSGRLPRAKRSIWISLGNWWWASGSKDIRPGEDLLAGGRRRGTACGGESTDGRGVYPVLVGDLYAISARAGIRNSLARKEGRVLSLTRVPIMHRTSGGSGSEHRRLLWSVSQLCERKEDRRILVCQPWSLARGEASLSPSAYSL